MPNLFPEGYETEVITTEELQEGTAVGYKRGVAFDAINGDFLRDGRNQMISSTGIESWESWCINCLQTERYKHLAYSTDFGIEIDAVFAATSMEEAENILTRQITEALLADPYGRTEYIEEIEYNWTGPDSVELHIIVHGKDDVTIDITSNIAR